MLPMTIFQEIRSLGMMLINLIWTFGLRALVGRLCCTNYRVSATKMQSRRYECGDRFMGVFFLVTVIFRLTDDQFLMMWF